MTSIFFEIVSYYSVMWAVIYDFFLFTWLKMKNFFSVLEMTDLGVILTVYIDNKTSFPYTVN